MNDEIQEIRYLVGEAWKGTYSPTTPYGNANVVQDPTGLSVYRSLKPGNVGHPLTDTAWWFCIIDLSSIKAESDRIAALNTAIAQDEQLRVAAEQSRVQAEQARVDAEAGRVTAEQGRVTAEQQRVSAEQQRASQEQTRISQEQSRVAAEQGRVAAESQRVQKEQLRENNEAQRVINEINRVAAEAERVAQYAADHQQAVADHDQYVIDNAQLTGLVERADDDHTQAVTDHTQAVTDHNTAVADHTQAGNDHTRAESDHTQAGTDHTQAGSDHTRAESDHTRAESDHAAVEVYVDSLGAFDISAYHATGGVLAKYADLTAALGTNGANIPDALRKGGMSVKFVLSSDNKYVQYFCKAQSFTTDISEWEKTNLEKEVSALDVELNGGNVFAEDSVVNLETTGTDAYQNTGSACVDGEQFKIKFIFSQPITSKIGIYAFSKLTEIGSCEEANSIIESDILTCSGNYQYIRFAILNTSVTSGISYSVTVSKLDSVTGLVEDVRNLDGRLTVAENELSELAEKVDGVPDYIKALANSPLELTATLPIGTTYKNFLANWLNKGTVLKITNKQNSDKTIWLRNGDTSTGQLQVSLTSNETRQIILTQDYDRFHIYDGASTTERTISFDVVIAEVDKNYNYAYRYDGDNLFVAYLDNSGVEYTYWFTKCMANELFTFHEVGYRNVNRVLPSTDGIETGSGITIINRTNSDNIGPLGMHTGGYVGGAHTYNNGSVKTAETMLYNIYADDKLIIKGSGYANRLVVKVNNIFYDPAYPPESGDTILSTRLCSEIETYVINKNTIEVGVEVQFVSTTNNFVGNYYGMQSSCIIEEYIITPNGEYVDWKATTPTDFFEFTKSEYPHFNRFIEKSVTAQAYQAAYLIPSFGLGKHNKLIDNNNKQVFTRSNGKDYHRCMTWVDPVAGNTYQWAGSYTFFKNAIVDNNYVFAYLGTIRGKDALFIHTKQAFDGDIDIPSELSLRKINIVENYGITNEDNEADIELGAKLHIKSASTGSLIIEFL